MFARLANGAPSERKGRWLATVRKDTFELVKVGPKLLNLFFSLLDLNLLLLQDQLKVSNLLITFGQCVLQLLYRSHPGCGWVVVVVAVCVV